MPHFGEFIKEFISQETTSKNSDAPYANPDKLILPGWLKGVRDSSPAHKSDAESPLTNAQFDRLDRLATYKRPRPERFVGEPGNSLALPDITKKTGLEAKAYLDTLGLKGIEYRNNRPDFSPVVLESVAIPYMTADIAENYRQAYKATAEKWNAEGRDGRSDWKPSDVKHWKQDNDLVIHENQDLKTCEFMPRIVHEHFPHSGGRCAAALLGRFEVPEQYSTEMTKGDDFYDQFDA